MILRTLLVLVIGLFLIIPTSSEQIEGPVRWYSFDNPRTRGCVSEIFLYDDVHKLQLAYAREANVTIIPPVGGFAKRVTVTINGQPRVCREIHVVKLIDNEHIGVQFFIYGEELAHSIYDNLHP